MIESVLSIGMIYLTKCQGFFLLFCCIGGLNLYIVLVKVLCGKLRAGLIVNALMSMERIVNLSAAVKVKILKYIYNIMLFNLFQ